MADVTIAGLSEATPNKNTATIPFTDGLNTYRTAASGIVAASPGCILQVKQAVKTDVETFYEGYYQDIANLSLIITPKTLNSTFMLMGTVSLGTTIGQAPGFRFTRNGIGIGLGQAATGRFTATTWVYSQSQGYIHAVPLNYLDSTSLSNLNPITYKIQIRGNNPNNNTPMTINANYGDPSGASNNDNQARCISTLSIWEIAG
jgi:hypothetical protein